MSSGCGCKEVYIDILILLIPTPLVSAPFCSSIHTFVHLKKIFCSFISMNGRNKSQKIMGFFIIICHVTL